MHLKTENSLQQKIFLAPRRQLFLALLNLPYIDLNGLIKEQVEQNPCLDYEAGWKNLPLKSDIPDTNFYMDYLVQQLHLSTDSDRLIEAGEYVIENLETDGYLRKSASEIASEGGYTEKDIEKAAGLLHALEPAGIGTGNLRECFLAQIERYFPEDKLLHSIVYSHWESLIKKNYRKISDETGVPVSDISKSVSHIKKLAVAPLAGFFKKNRVFIIPEGKIEKEGESLKVSVEEKILPFLRINDLHERYSGNPLISSRERKYIEKKIKQARVLIEVLHERHKFLTEVFQEVADCQKAFLLGGNLVPLREREIAAKKNVSVSTVSRAVNRKYIDTPKGLMKIKDFFSAEVGGHSLSKHFIIDKMKEIIAGEKEALSDMQIVKRLSEHNVKISVRTVNKYRHHEGIFNSYLRR
ncbi:MAG TPA: hypothetical protein PKN36_05665 [bacterium]|nr:hypothetical protein [bacterium]